MTKSIFNADGVITRKKLDQITDRIRNFDRHARLLEAQGKDSSAELKRWVSERSELLEEVGSFDSSLRGEDSPGCPAWQVFDDFSAAELLRDASRVHSRIPVPLQLIGGGVYDDIAITTTLGVNQAPPGQQGLASTPSGGFNGFMQAGEGETSHYYSDWQSRAQLPAAPSDGRINYEYIILTGSTWLFWGSHDGWVQTFVTPLVENPGITIEGEDICGYISLVDWTMSEDAPRNDSATASTYIRGSAFVRAGQELEVGCNHHIYAGITDGLGRFIGSVYAGNYGRLRYEFIPTIVAAPIEP